VFAAFRSSLNLLSFDVQIAGRGGRLIYCSTVIS
jgi:hypothetical protein